MILPNDADSVQVAQIAARTATEDEGLRNRGHPHPGPGAGPRRSAVHEPGRSFRQDVLEMTATARHARHGAVTIAMTAIDRGRAGGRRARRDRGDFAVVGADLFGVATEVLDRLLGGGGELATIVAGAPAGDGPTLPTWPGAAPGGWSTTMSTSWCTTVGRSATRCSCPSNEPGAAMISLDSPVATVLGDHP